ncbi:Kinesin-like motor 9 [Lecanosticta acicola]|uniref:Kinesin-like protein n=1 Tax=Lecanosticta acicola TaxID=111012 RepID=A0AAI8YVK0_9PEZI|nr:Kinesin-like motor 9 [Lecanosticta acicola]
MEGQRSSAVFDVFLRLRPSASDRERFLDVEHTNEDCPTHITIKPPTSDTRRKAVERFAFTRVFEENAGQKDVFEATGAVQLVQGVLGQPGKEGRDGLLATLGVTGSGKSHTILGSKTQRGLTQLALDVLFQHTEPQLVSDGIDHVYSSLCAADVSDAQLYSADFFLDSLYGNGDTTRLSRATTPAFESSFLSAHTVPPKRVVPRTSTLPASPSVDDIDIEIDEDAEYAIVISMYEVYNDRIFDLLTASVTQGKSPAKRRHLLYKYTEGSPYQKVVTGLRKVVCSSLEEALLVLETGLQERRVAGTGSNAVSSRSHGFFCVEVKKRLRGRGIPGPWYSSTMTIVDLAGSERARQAKTAGATLAEAGKINESLMYLGQCMQIQADNARTVNFQNVPFRQCKLTELLFSNSFVPQHHRKPPQKAIMIVTADPLGDFNATSQILKYSALATEVTVPRVPSVTSTILAGTGVRQHSRPTTPAAVVEELEAALAEVARLREELEITQLQLEEETQRRVDAEASWSAAEMKIDEVEAEIREEVWSEMETKLAQEQRRWRAARDEELDRADEHLDRKLEIMSRGIEVYEDPEDYGNEEKENVNVDAISNGLGKLSFNGKVKDSARVQELEEENAQLRERLALAEREKGLRSPSKKMRVLKSRKWDGSGMGIDGEL